MKLKLVGSGCAALSQAGCTTLAQVAPHSQVAPHLFAYRTYHHDSIRKGIVLHPNPVRGLEAESTLEESADFMIGPRSNETAGAAEWGMRSKRNVRGDTTRAQDAVRTTARFSFALD